MVDSSEADVCVVCGRVHIPSFTADPSEVGNDVGALRARVAALEIELEHRDWMLSMVAHDARNPLVAIDGHVGLLTGDPAALSENERAFSFETLRRQTDRLGALIDDLLTVQTIEGGGLDLLIESVELRRAVELAVVDCDMLDVVDVDNHERMVARVDRRRINQILSNLLSNAQQSGAPPIVVTATQTGGTIDLFVRDHGPGIAEEFIPVLFERFSRGSRRQHPSQRGTGLGLPIARTLARAQGGDVNYERQADGGRFVVTLLA